MYSTFIDLLVVETILSTEVNGRSCSFCSEDHLCRNGVNGKVHKGGEAEIGRKLCRTERQLERFPKDKNDGEYRLLVTSTRAFVSID